MCLGVPGKVLSIERDPLGMNMGKVSFAGITKRVCLAYTPEAEVGDYVVVHVGFAISRIDEGEARKVFEFLGEMDELGELDIPQPPAPPEVLAPPDAPAPSDVAKPPAITFAEPSLDPGDPIFGGEESPTEDDTVRKTP